MTDSSIFKSFCTIQSHLLSILADNHIDGGGILCLDIMNCYMHSVICSPDVKGASAYFRSNAADEISSVSSADAGSLKRCIDLIPEEMCMKHLKGISGWGLSKATYHHVFRICFEKYLTKKETASYYTDDLTTYYIISNTIVNHLLAGISADGVPARRNPVAHLAEMYLGLHGPQRETVAVRLRNIRVIDPTCGTGSFIIKSLDVLREIYLALGMEAGPADIKRMIAANLFGVDIDREALEILKYRLYAYMYYSYGLVIGSDDLVGFRYGNTISDEEFDWNAEFAGVFAEGGFDCAVGNPPYIELSRLRPDYAIPDTFRTLSCGNIYANVLERAAALLSTDGTMGFIVPISIVSTPRMKPLRDLLDAGFSNQAYINFADRPCSLFHGVHQKLSVVLAGNMVPERMKYVSGYRHWYQDEEERLYEDMDLIPYEGEDKVYPKLVSGLSGGIIDRVCRNGAKPLTDNCSPEGGFEVWLNMRMTFWCKCFLDRKESNEYKKFTFASREDACLFAAVMNSSLFYYLWEIYSDCWHITRKELEMIRIDFHEIPREVREEAARLFEEFEHGLEQTKKYIGSVQTDYIYQHKLHKRELDRIDDLLGGIFGLDDRQLEEIKGYQLRYRLNTNGNECC